MRARRYTICDACGDPIVPGAWIAAGQDGWQHAHCADDDSHYQRAARDRRDTRGRCLRCADLLDQSGTCLNCG